MNRISAILLGLAAACCLSCKADIPLLHQTREKQPVKVSVIEMEPASFPERYSYVGTVVSSKDATVLSPHSGTLTELKVRKGDVVKAGEVLAVVKSQTAESAFKVAEANLTQAQDGFDRASKVYSEGSISEVQYMDIKTKLAQAQAAMESASKSLEDCRMKAPYSGVVNDVYVSEGEEMTVGRRVASVLDMSGLEIRIPVHENEVGRISEGATALVDVPAFGVEGLKARVISKSLIASALSHSYDCTLRLDRIPAGLLPGMSVKVRFSAPGQEVLTVPAKAVQLDRNGRFVWLCEDGTVRKAYVTVAGYSGTGVIVSEGLAIGDKVVVAGYQKVSGGMKVTVE